MSNQDSRLPVLLVILFLIWLFPDPPPSPLGGHSTLDRILLRERAELGVCNVTGYGGLEGAWRDGGTGGSGGEVVGLNITGLRAEDGFAWDALTKVKGRARERVLHIFGEEAGGRALAGGLEAGGGGGGEIPVWRNVSGHVRGSWVRGVLESEIRRPVLNLSRILPYDAPFTERAFERNISGATGELRVEFKERGELDGRGGVGMQNIKAEVTIADETSSGDGWVLVLYGTHYVESGQILLTTSSSKFAGMWALPQLALTEGLFGPTQEAVVERLEKIIEKQTAHEVQALNPYSSVQDGLVENPYAPQCEMIAYLQQHPLQVLQPDGKLVAPTPGMIADMEHEMRYPEGARPFEIPPLTMSAVIFSPDCGFVIESKGPPEYAAEEGDHLVGEKWEVYIRTSIDWTLVFGLILAAQIWLTVKQMKHSSTPSTRSRISIYTIGLLSLGDGFVGMAFLPMGMLIDSMFTPLLSAAFFAFLAVTFFDMRFLFDVWSVQIQERRRQERQIAAANEPTTPPPTGTTTPAAAPVPIITAAGADTLPLPVTANQTTTSGATPMNLPPTQDTPPESEAAAARRELGTLYGKFYLTLLCITFLSLHANSWPPPLRSLYVHLLATIYASMWLPQIHRNAMRNCRKALLYKFVGGQSLLRMAPIGYFYCVEGNVLWARTDRRVFLGFVAWVWVQIVVLVAQDVLGPRVGVPKGWVPRAYEYHPLLREDEEEDRMPIGFSGEGGESREKGKRVYDCAICMQDVEVVVVPAGGGAEGGRMAELVARRAYMVTPCRHIFHTKCLEAAMRYRLQCPICREGLPPL